MPPLCRIEISELEGFGIAGLAGEVDLSNVEEIEAELRTRISDVGALVVDLSELEYIDSSGLGMLERLAQEVVLRLVVAPDAVIRRTLQVTGIDQIVGVFPTRAAAIVADRG